MTKTRAAQPTSGAASSLIERRLRHARGFRVDAPEGEVGFLVGVPLAGRPPRPLVLVVRDGDSMRFVSVRRVVDVSSDERRIRLGPDADGDPT
ncbi:MAG TPA: hypothetical protein VIA10_06690 [Gaiellaceae bacterium]|jgi:hypothetical protein